MESCFFNHSSEVMNQLLGCIQDNLDREIKLSIICCMGDLFLSIQEYTCNFIDEVIKICDLSFAAVYQLTPKPQDMDYVEELKSNLIEMYSCVVFAANQKKVNKPLYDHYGNLATFIVRTCDKNVHPTVVIFLFYFRNTSRIVYIYSTTQWPFTGMEQQSKITTKLEISLAQIKLENSFGSLKSLRTEKILKNLSILSTQERECDSLLPSEPTHDKMLLYSLINSF